MNPPEMTWATAIGTAAGALAAGAIWAVRKLYPDKTEERNAKANRDMISTLEHERDEARDEAKSEREHRTLDARKIERLEAEAESRAAEKKRLERDVRLLLRFAPKDVREARETDFAPMGGPSAERTK